MIDKALRYKGITGELVALPFTDKHLITYKESVQRLYSLKVVNGIEIMSLILEAQQLVVRRLPLL